MFQSNSGIDNTILRETVVDYYHHLSSPVGSVRRNFILVTLGVK